MIWQGEITACSDIAFSMAIDQSMDVYTRINGIRCIEVAGSDKQKTTLAQVALDDETLSFEKITAELIEALSPDYLSIDNIMTLVSRLEIKDRYSASWIIDALENYTKETCLKELLLKWIKALLPLITQPPFVERRYCNISKKYSWLLSIAIDAVERLSQADRDLLLDEEVIEIIFLSQRANDYGIDHDKEKYIAEMVQEEVEFKRMLFWFDVCSVRKNEYDSDDKRLTFWWQAGGMKKYWKFSVSDFDAVLIDIKNRPIMDDKLVALSLAFQIYRESGRDRKCLCKLKKSVAGISELEESLHGFLHPPKMTEVQRKRQQKEAAWKRSEKKRKIKKTEEEQESKMWLLNNTHVLRDASIASKGEVWNGTSYLLERIRKSFENHNRWTQFNWQSLIPEFGKEVAEALRDGCIDYWRQYKPELRSDGKDSGNQIPYALIVGLSGIAMEAAMSTKWASKLTEDEARLACRYAIREMNSFPDWLSLLWTEHRKVVQNVLLEEIKWEFKEYNGEQPCHYVLSGISWGADWIKPYIANNIIDLLKQYDPVHDDSIEQAIKIVLASPILNLHEFSKLSEASLRKKLSLNRTTLWLAAWMFVDSGKAIEKLKTILLDLEKSEEATNFSMLFLQALIGGRHDRFESEYNDYNNVDKLTELIKIMYRYIRTSEDIERAGTGIYSPDLRDDAQRARDSLLQKLFDIPGKATYLALLDLAAELHDQNLKEGCVTLAKRRAESDADLLPWQLADVISFADMAECQPRTHHELYNLGRSKLNDLKAELEDGDSSIVNFLKLESSEIEHRKFIGQWLREHSHGHYSVPQEEELADGSRMDIRIHGNGFDAPVPIELKIADNKLTITNLIERLNNQLCGQYLRDTRSNCGIFLVVYLGNKKYWEGEAKGERYSFDELIQILRSNADLIVTNHRKIEALDVVSIDLSKRLKKQNFIN